MALRIIIIIIGPAGCGKTTIAKSLATNLNLPYIEGDDFHPPQNITKMANGIPLTDDERWGWLEALRVKAIDQTDGCIVSCSCLKRKYRDVLRVKEQGVTVRFVYLAVDESLVLERVRARKGHYMRDEMVHSQFVELEEPGEDERDVFVVEAGGEKEDVLRRAMEVVVDCMR